MIILRKKHFIYILSFLMLSFSFYFAGATNKKMNIQNRSYDIMQVSSLPISQKVVVIDAGHGGEDGGAVRL